MAMTKAELRALPQSEFVRHGGACGFDICGECETRIEYSSGHSYWNKPAKFTTIAICPSCYAAHPSDEPKRRFVSGKNGYILWSQGRCYAKTGGDSSSQFKSADDALADTVYDFEITLDEARAWAEKHGHVGAIFGGEPTEAEPEEKPWQYGRDSDDGELLRWRELGGKYEHMLDDGIWQSLDGYGMGPADCVAGNGQFSLITRDQAIAHAREWGSAWAEEMEPAEPAQPVGYSCTVCGAMLDQTDEAAWLRCPRCQMRGQRDYSWVLPGPLPGPWQEDERVDGWSGMYRAPRSQEWFVRPNGDAIQMAPRQNPPDFEYNRYHILRPKADPQPGEQCRMCSVPAYDCTKGNHAPFHAADANPTNDCEQFIAKTTPPYEGDPADAAFNIGVDAAPGAEWGCETDVSIDDDGVVTINDVRFTKRTPSGKDRTMQATIAKFHDNPKCPKCKQRMYTTIHYEMQDDGMLHARCKSCRTDLTMPTADAGRAIAAHRIILPIPAAKTLGKTLILWPVATTAKLAIGFAKWAGFTGTLATAAATTVAVRNPERFAMAAQWFWGMLG